ncbi:hypothetical protein IGI04_006839 [Brassica rapa subsp. trilocularis]|uniref:CCHC-type domain-containing protein n=1 Tax=Brassica rapa subsp. trilocularis TaxID=1813537 RepID=A0ABQ7NI39_BRACM|nr:hypothetical protein IGI04_006839 [Brassica rapa subsp. trilocularis]
MLELCLHFSSAMNSVCGLRFSIPYLAGQLPCCSPLLLFPFQMPPRRRITRAQTARAVRDDLDEHEQPAVPPPAAPPVDQDALRQMVQDAARQAAQEALQQIAQEAARQAAQEAARIAAQEVARQMAAVQQGPQVQVQQGPQIRVQQVPPVQVQQDQHDHQDPVQQVPLPQVPLQHGPAQQFAHGVQDLPPLPPRPHVYPVYDERFYRLTRQMRNMDMEHFSGTVDAVAAHDWKLALQRKLEIIECPPELSLRLTMQFAGEGILEEDLMRKFLNGIRVEIRNRCRVVTYHRLGDLVEKAAEQEAGLAEEQKYSKAVQPKFAGTSEAQQRTWDKPSIQCFYCGKMGHKSRVCRSRLFDAQVAPPVRQIAAPAAPAAAHVCFGCGHPGHFIRDCPRRGNAALPPPLKRLAIAPCAFAVGDPHGAEPISGSLGGIGFKRRPEPSKDYYSRERVKEKKIGTTACCHQESSPEPPHARTSSSSSSPSTSAENRRKPPPLKLCFRPFKPPSCSSRRDEAVATDHAAIGVRTKPLEPPEVSPLCARELYAPPPEIVSAAFAAVSAARPPPHHHRNAVAVAVLRLLSPPSSAVTTELTGLTFDHRIDFSINLDQTRFKPFERRSDSIFRPDFRFGVYLSIWNSQGWDEHVNMDKSQKNRDVTRIVQNE